MAAILVGVLKISDPPTPQIAQNKHPPKKNTHTKTTTTTTNKQNLISRNREMVELPVEWFLRRKNNLWLGWNTYYKYLKRYALSMRDKTAAGAFGCAMNYGSGGPFKQLKSNRKREMFSLNLFSKFILIQRTRSVF